MRRGLTLLACALAILVPVGCRATCYAPCPPYGHAVPPSLAPTAPPVSAPPAALSVPSLDAEDPATLVAALRAGNERFRTGKARHGRQDAARRAALANHQAPKVAVLACADSRVAPEVLFDQGLGDLFVIRVAGNVSSDEVTASLEYAVEHLGTRLIVVLGHERCGAVKAALAGGDLPGHLPALIGRLAPAVASVPADAPDREDATIAANARLTAEALATSEPILSEAVEAGHVSVLSAVYDLDTGEVTFHPATHEVRPNGHPERLE